MKSRARAVLIAAVFFAVIVEGLGFVGWVAWRRTVRLIESRPTEGARVLAESPWLRLPSAIRLLRRLPARELGEAHDAAVIPALRAMSTAQIRWLPSDPNGFKNLARVMLIEGGFDGAVDQLDRALLRDPTSPGLHRLMALAERARGRPKATLDHLATAEGLAPGLGGVVVELTPEDSMWVRLEGLKRHLDLYPRSRVRGTIRLAQELRRRGEGELGRVYLEKEESDPRVSLELARWDLADGQAGEAEGRLRELVRRQGLTASIRAQTWAVTAMVRDHRGDPEGALAAANEALRFDPRSPAPYRVLAGLAERRGDLNEALDHLRRAWGMNPADIGLLLSVASVAERAGHPDDARLALERAVAVDPDSPVIRARLADFLLRQGDYMEATLTLSAALDRFPTDARLLALAERLRAEVSRRP